MSIAHQTGESVHLGSRRTELTGSRNMVLGAPNTHPPAALFVTHRTDGLKEFGARHTEHPPPRNFVRRAPNRQPRPPRSLVPDAPTTAPLAISFVAHLTDECCYIETPRGMTSVITANQLLR
ncbi:hypothetical protein CC2G_000310 [Coprinopsis cinerea AmutBmut pab1-1]|nr:hypothetical protein CC2G_000310 [Coprinopsis cinerea AmutBmut pab1-1]